MPCMLIDRGEKQFYGTQVVWDELGNAARFNPILNPVEVDERRKKIGLSPMKRYARLIGLKWEY